MEQKVIGTIVSIKGKCVMGHKVGDTFELSATSADGLCGEFYHSIYAYVVMMEYGGGFPDDIDDEWPGLNPEFICVDAYNQARIQLRLEGAPEERNPLYTKKEVERDIKMWKEILKNEK